jgi:hypothetical protein
MSEGLIGGEGFAIDASVIRADASRARGIDGHSPIAWNTAQATRAVREYLEALDARVPEEISPTSPKRISPTDPSARWTAAPGGPDFYAYSTNYLIDLRAGIIMDVEATPAYRSQEVDCARTMIDRVEQRLQLKPQRMVGDAAYGTAALLGWMVEEKAIERTCQYGTNPSDRMGRSQAATLSGTKQPMKTAVRRDMHFAAPIGSKVPTTQLPKTTRSSIDPIRQLEESQRLASTGGHAANARRSQCSSLT